MQAAFLRHALVLAVFQCSALAQTAHAAPSAKGGVIYQGQSDSGSIVLSDAPEDGGVKMKLQAPSTANDNASSLANRPTDSGVMSHARAMERAQNVQIESQAVLPALQYREQALATRITQMIHRRNGLTRTQDN